MYSYTYGELCLKRVLIPYKVTKANVILFRKTALHLDFIQEDMDEFKGSFSNHEIVAHKNVFLLLHGLSRLTVCQS